MQKKILAIASEMNGGLDAALLEAGYSCARVASIREALLAVERGRFDLVLLDAALPEERPADFISLLRANVRCPILAIASAADVDKLIELLDTGADDYLTRPFELRELTERIEIQLRRFAKVKSPGVLCHRELELDPNTFGVLLRGEPVRLTKQEFRILELMMLSPPGRVFSKQDFFDYAWERGYMGIDKTINVHICNIRRKFKEITDEAYIETIWGLGFRLV